MVRGACRDPLWIHPGALHRTVLKWQRQQRTGACDWLQKSSRLWRSGIRYHAGVIILKSIWRHLFLDSIVCGDNRLEEFFSMVTYRGRKCELSVNLGGNAGPGSRPKGAWEPGFLYLQRLFSWRENKQLIYLFYRRKIKWQFGKNWKPEAWSPR